MQPQCEDYSAYDLVDGCCLNCRESEPGCLCYECKCKQCYWYSSPEEYDKDKGHCDKTDELKRDKFQKMLKKWAKTPGKELDEKVRKWVIKEYGEEKGKAFVMQNPHTDQFI